MANKAIQIEAKNRPELGSRANKRLRTAGHLPGVVYGHKEAVIPVTLPKKEIVNHLRHGAHLFELSLDGKKQPVLIKEVQYDHLNSDVIHVDFARVSLDEKVEVTVPIELKGTPKGEAEEGVLQQIMNDIEIECLVTDIPDVIRVAVDHLGIDDEIRIKDLKLPAGVRALQDEDNIVASVKIIEEETAEAAEGEAEPEVIGKKAEDGAEGAAEGAETK
jgi:large subunit ribosomal protein L25